jgi:hypothetical protein
MEKVQPLYQNLYKKKTPNRDFLTNSPKLNEASKNAMEAY